MKIFSPSRLIGTATLGLAYFISAGSAENKKEIPNAPEPAQVKKETQPVVKLPAKAQTEKANLNEKLIEEIYNYLDKGFEKLNDREKAAIIFNQLPEEEKVTIAKKVFTDIKQSFINNAPDLKKQEDRTSYLLGILEMSLRINNQIFKEILLKTKDEYQDLIEMYTEALSNPNKDAKRNVRMLNLTTLSYIPRYAPPKLFNEKWYPHIEKILDRADKEFKPRSEIRARVIRAISNLSVLELRDDSGIKNPKIYFDLIKQLDKNFEQNWLDIVPDLFEILENETIANDNPKGKRIIIGFQGRIDRALLNDALAKPFEEIIKRSLAKLPKNSNEYNRALEIAFSLCSYPFYIDNPEFIIAWQESILAKITKSKSADIPELLENFRARCNKWDPNPSYDKHREIFKEGAKYLKPILEIGCKHLLDKDGGNNLIGSLIVRNVRQAYSDYGPHDFSKDGDIKHLFLQVLDKMQKEELKANDAFAKCLGSTVDFVHLSWKDPDVVREAARSLTAQVNYAHKAKNNGLDKEWAEIKEVALLNTTDEFVGWMWSVFGTRFDNETISKNIDPLYRSIGEKIVKDNSNLKVLHEGRKLVKYLHRFRLNEKPPDEASRKFVEETIIDLLFKNILESSAKLPPLERKSFLNILQEEDLSWFFGGINKEDLTAVTKTLRIFSNHYFDLKDDKNLEHFSRFIKAKIDVHNFNRWHPAVVCELLNLNRGYLKAAVNETVKNIESNKKEYKELPELEHLTVYLESLKHLQDLLKKDSETSFYPKEKALDVETFVRDSSRNCSGLFFKRLQDEKVIVERSNDGEHTVYDKGFELTIRGLRAITFIHPDQLTDCINISTKRLNTEKDPRTRGELYKASFTIPLNSNFSDTFRKAIVMEHSPLTLQIIGEIIADKFIDELLGGESRVYIFRGYRNYHNGPRYNEIEKLNLDKKMEDFDGRLKKAIEKEVIEPNEKTPAQDFILNSVLYSRGINLESILKETLGDNPLKKLNSKGELAPETIKTVHRTLSNANSILSVFGNELNKEAKYIALNYHDEEDALRTNGLKRLLIVRHVMKLTGYRITELLENNLRWRSNVDTFPSVVNGLILLSSHRETLDDYNKDIDRLSERLFKGTNEKLSIFELYEISLQSKYVWKYLEDYRESKHNKVEKAEVEELCKKLLRSIEDTEKIKDVQLRIKLQKSLNPILKKLDEKRFPEMVTNPLHNARLHFIREFVVLAPSKQRKEYIDIVLNRFGLGSYVSELELKNVLVEK